MQRNGHDRGAISAIARELGLNRSTVLRHARMGMPLTSTDAARDWRARNLNPAQTKGNRLDLRGDSSRHSKAAGSLGTPSRRATSAAQAAAADGLPESARRALVHATQLATLAAELLEQERFASIEGPLRQALAAIPPAYRDRLLIDLGGGPSDWPFAIPVAVMDELTREICEACEPRDEVMSDEEAEAGGRILFAAAAGEPIDRLIAS